MVKKRKDPFKARNNSYIEILLLCIFIVGCIVDMFFIPPTFDLGSDGRLFALVALWIFVSKLSGFNSMATFKISIGFLIILFIYFIFFPANPAIERVGSFLYMFLLIGVVQQFFEKRKQRQKTFS